MRAIIVVSFVIAVFSASAVRAQAPEANGQDRQVFARSPQYPLLPRPLEIELALSAAPKHLRDTATVWVLEQTGYTTAQHGSNAFTCLVIRRAGDLFPVCWDAEGARSLLPLDVDDAQMRLSGKSGAEIEAIVGQRFTAAGIARRRERALHTCCRPCATGSTSTARSRERRRTLI